MSPEVRLAIADTLGSRVVHARAVSGGDINRAFCVELEDGRRVFVKANENAPSRMFETEARGLDWLRATAALAVPSVLGVGTTPSPRNTRFLALQWVESGSKGPRFDEQLGEGLARLHRMSTERFGLEHDNFIGRLPQCNRQYERFQDFFVEQRLCAQFERAVKAGHFDTRTQQRFARLLDRVGDLLGPQEPPAKLHGDLWSGNVMVGQAGEPWLIDPAVYAGHREIDLAMMQLFGGFSSRVFHAYAATFPLLPGHSERLHLMQLYPLLVHVNLFGGGYVAAVCGILDEYLR